MKITAIHTHYVRIPFDMGAPKQEFAGLRFPTMDHLLVGVETDAVGRLDPRHAEQ